MWQPFGKLGTSAVAAPAPCNPTPSSRGMPIGMNDICATCSSGIDRSVPAIVNWACQPPPAPCRPVGTGDELNFPSIKGNAISSAATVSRSRHRSGCLSVRQAVGTGSRPGGRRLPGRLGAADGDDHQGKTELALSQGQMAELVDDLTNEQRYGVPAGIFDRGEADPATVLAVWRVRQAVGGGANRMPLDRREIQLRDARTAAATS